jgi:hypothetical protein
MQKVITNQVMPIEIPVPAPESGAVAPSTRLANQPLALQRTTAPMPTTAFKPEQLPANALLPVPGSNIPVGTIGSMPSVYVSSAGGRANVRTASSANYFSAVGVRYRVIANPNTEMQQAQLQGEFPNAFPILSKGRRVLQLGAFSDRAKADQLVQTLTSQGVVATLETVE